MTTDWEKDYEGLWIKNPHKHRDIKELIKTLLAKERQAGREEATEFEAFKAGYNKAVADVKEILEARSNHM